MIEALIESVERWLEHPIIGKSVSALFAVILIFILVRVLMGMLSRYIADPSLRYRVRKALSFLGYLLAAFVVAIVFSDRLGRISVIFGVTGAGIAFALQEVIASVAGWTAVSFGGYYQVGDRVELGGIRGDVIDIGLLRTTLVEVGNWVNGDLYSGRVVRMANSFIFKRPVVNYSGDFPFLWDEIVVPVRFGSDLDRTQTLLEEIVRQTCNQYSQEAEIVWDQMQKRYPLQQATTDSMVTMAFDENWVSFTIRYVVPFNQRRAVQHLLWTYILREIKRTEGAIEIAANRLELARK